MPVKSAAFAVPRTNPCSRGYVQHQLRLLGLKGRIITNAYVFSSLLRLCIDGRFLGEGRHVHHYILKNGVLPNIHLGTALVNMYAKCGVIQDAENVFTGMPERNIFTWNTMILSLVNVGQIENAVFVFRKMTVGGAEYNEVTYVTMLRAFASYKALEHGALMHVQLIFDGMEITILVWNALLDMYIKCGRLDDAVCVFGHMTVRDVSSWTLMMSGNIEYGNVLAALQFFSGLLIDGLEPDEVAFMAVLHGCAISGNAYAGKQVHALLLEISTDTNKLIGGTIVDMYAKCGSMHDAQKVFDDLLARDIVTWNALLTGYAEYDSPEKLFSLFQTMCDQSVKGNGITLISMLNACAKVEDVKSGMVIHDHALQTEMESYVMVGNALTSMYLDGGRIADAWVVFDKMQEHDLVSWNLMISGLIKHDHASEALNLFQRMEDLGVESNESTFVSVLNAIATTNHLEQGRILHARIVESGLYLNNFIANTLIDVYAKCGSLQDALGVFSIVSNKDVVTYNAILLAFSLDELHDMAIHYFWKMQLASIKPDGTTFARVLHCCASMGCSEMGHLIHAYLVEIALTLDASTGSNLVEMYVKSGSLCCARWTFDRLSEKDIMAWTSLMSGYTNTGEGKLAMALFDQMVVTGSQQDAFTFMNMLNACAGLSALGKGKMVHCLIMENGSEGSILVGNALINMYSKSGSTMDARKVLDMMVTRDVVTWNTMILGYAQHGDGMEALQLAQKMQYEGFDMNHVTYLAVMSACSHAGLAAEVLNHVCSLIYGGHRIKLASDHYACMIDTIGRMGHLGEAFSILDRLPCEPSSHMWKALLRACHIHCNVSVGEIVAGKVLKSEPECADTHVMLSNIYGMCGRWHDRAQLIKVMQKKGLRKQAGRSYIEIGSEVHGFVANDTSHPQTDVIHRELNHLFGLMDREGYEPDTSFVRQDAKEEDKKLLLLHHSEKLAIAFGLINSLPGTPLRIIKNLRVCGDCHTASKFISKIAKRDIILRDCVRFHHIRDGVCSCGDYW